MGNTMFLLLYLITFVICLILTIGLISILNKGLKKFFENLSQDADIAKFFVKLTKVIILFAGISAALTSSFHTSSDANWLTITWDVAGQLEHFLSQLFIIMMIFTIAFLILHLISRRISK